MNNEEMFQVILNRMDSMEGSLNGRIDQLETDLNGRMDKLDGRMDTMENGLNDLSGRMDKLESGLELEFFAVRKEMDAMNKSIQEQINVLNNKIDRLMFTKDVEGYDKMNIRLEVLERGYQELKEKIV